MRSLLKWSGFIIAVMLTVMLMPHGAAMPLADSHHLFTFNHQTFPMLGAVGMLNWIDKEQLLTNAALTVRAQAQSVIDLGLLNSPTFFPRVDARSVKLSDITTLDARPVADRREWNAPGRQIPLITPSFRDVEMLPVESYFRMEEQEMQRIAEGALGSEAIFRQIVGPDVPVRTDKLVSANLRRIDVDAFKAWSLGIVTVRNPQGIGADKTLDFQFSASRYVTPAAWTGTVGSGTAWSQFMLETFNASTLIGAVRGAVMRRSTYVALQNTAPLRTGQAYPLSKQELQQIISAEIGGPFAIIVFEDSVDVFDDGGLSYTRTKIWTAERVAWIPESGIIGSTYYAPSVNGFQMAQANPGMAIDVRGMSVVRTIGNEGKDLTVRCQVNALAVPNEQALYVVDAGI